MNSQNKMPKGKFCLLGSGASTGIPVLNCSCSTCQSKNKKNHRLRSSSLITIEKSHFLIDCGPDFRQQAMTHQIHSIDALFITHTHFDHIAGIDELRSLQYNEKKSIPCFLSSESLKTMQKRYDYFFVPQKNRMCECTDFDFRALKDREGQFQINGIEVGYCTFLQCGMRVTGYRVGSLALISDIREYDDSIFDALHGIRYLIISAKTEIPTIAHFSVDEAIRFAKRARVETAWLTHIGHEIEHEAMEKQLPPNIHMGYDGLEIEFET